MRPNDDSALIVDMWIHATSARRISGALDEARFLDDEIVQLALIKLIENIGEAARRVSGELRSETPGIPWQDIMGMRHRLVHDYRNVNLRMVWDVLQWDIPKLIDELERLLPPDDALSHG